jgi:hypothetical protein
LEGLALLNDPDLDPQEVVVSSQDVMPMPNGGIHRKRKQMQDGYLLLLLSRQFDPSVAAS